MKVSLERRGYPYSCATIHKYMNTELRLRSIVRPKTPGYSHGKPHKVFENKLQQDFQAERINQKWCTDFTYLFLKNGDVRYNCSIIDLYDRSIIASITDHHITSNLAIRTLQKALDTQPKIRDVLIPQLCASFPDRLSFSHPYYSRKCHSNRILHTLHYKSSITVNLFNIEIVAFFLYIKF